MAGFLFVAFYAAMAGAALIIEATFGTTGLIPREHQARVVEASIPGITRPGSTSHS
jgi:uncharacterized protein